MITAFSYARVSSKEQEEKKNSIPEQFNRIEKYADENNIKITKQFLDSNSAFHDENRTDFDRMIQLALIERPNYIILDDSSRFARTRQVAIETKALLRSYGIDIRYASEPNVDTNSVAGFWLEGIQEIKNEATSREISFHTKKGMTGNLNQRDVETGWCYKNGGKAPYGYQRNILYRGVNQKGKPIYKTIWELDPITSPIVKMIIVDLYTSKGMSYQSIRDYLNSHHIKNSNGGLWSISTISSMLTQDRLEEYSGIAIWNKSNKKIKGIKYNPKTEWVICENAHPAIITKEELENAINRKNKFNSSQYKFKSNSDFLLTGTNISDEFLFTCSECGGHVVGCSTGKKHVRKYGCGCNRYKGNLACSNNWKVGKDWIEDKVLQLIEENYICDKSINENIDIVYSKLCNMTTIFEKQIKDIESQISKIDIGITNLLNSIANGLDTELAIQKINNLKQEREDKIRELEKIKSNTNKKHIFSKEEISTYFYNIREIFYNSSLYEKRELLKTFISNISLNKKEHHIEIILYPQWCRTLEQVAGIEPA